MCRVVIKLNSRFKALVMSVIFFFCIFTSLGFTICSVRVLNENGETIKSYYSTADITTALSRAFDYTSKNANKNNILTVKISKGTYNVKSTVHLSSYTVVDLNYSVIKNANFKRGNIFKSPEDKIYPKYSSLTQCSIINGTLDGNYNRNRSCILRLCHSNNIKIYNVTFLNNYFSHHAELAACQNVTFFNCTFNGQVSDLNISSSEAIQIDILDRIHFYGFTSYDNTMNDNITIEKCTFKNVYRGVGTHNYFKDMYQTNITIIDCTFQNITDCAISAVNFKNIKFTNNKFLNCKYSAFYRDNGK